MYKILSVDDTTANQALINKVLSSEFDVTLAMTGEEGIAKFNEDKPDLVLMDVNLPDAKGYDLCKQIREDFQNDGIPILFVSALTSLEDRLEGYNSGGDDYICKPFEPKELKAKIGANLEVAKKLSDAKAHATYAQDAAFIAMTSTSEMGAVLEFLVKTMKTSSLDDVASALFEMLNTFQLSGAVAFRSHVTGEQFFSPAGVVRPLERELLERGEGAERIVCHKHLYMFNSPRSSILVKNMPKDEDVAGRLRDHLAIAVTVVEEKVQTLDIVNAAKKQQDQLLSTGITQVERTINKFDSRFSDFADSMKTKLDAMMVELQESMLVLGLTEDQEEALISKVQSQHDQLSEIYDETDDLERELIEASNTLRQALK